MSYVFDTTSVEDFEARVNGYIEGVKRQIAGVDGEIVAAWQGLNPIVSAWMQTEDSFATLDENMQQLVTRIASNVNYSDLGLDTEEKIKNYIKSNILEPISTAEPEVQNAITGMFTLKNAFGDGVINVGEYKSTIDEIIKEINECSALGASLMRVSILDEEDARAIKEIKKIMEINNGIVDDIKEVIDDIIKLLEKVKALVPQVADLIEEIIQTINKWFKK